MSLDEFLAIWLAPTIVVSYLLWLGCGVFCCLGLSGGL